VGGTTLNLRKFLKNALRKIVGWTLIVFSVFSFIACFILLGQGDLGSFVTGLIFSVFVFTLGWEIQTNLENKRKQITALMSRYFPTCPICKSDKSYEVRGFLPSSQYVRCKNCGAEWTSSNFAGYRDLKALKLWKPPEDPEVYAEFISQSPLKPKKTYPMKLWQALMNKEEIHLPPKAKRIQLEEFVSSHPKGAVLALVSFTLILIGLFSFTVNYSIGCFATSSGTSLVLTLVGFYGFSLSQEKAYILFWTTFFAMFFWFMTPF